MPNCKLIVDSPSDIPFEFIDREGIILLEFHYVFGSDEYADDLFRTRPAKEFYDRMRNGEFPTTAQIPLASYIETFTKLAEEGTPAVFLSLSSALSKSYDTALLAYDQVKAEHPELELYLVDTLQASAGECLIVHEAIRKWEAGLTAKEIADWANEARWKANMVLTVDSLTWLAHGGRMPSSLAFAGSKLNLKPILNIGKDGAVAPATATRGRKKSFAKLCALYDEMHDADSPCQQVFCHGGDCDADVSAVVDMMKKNHPGIEIYTGSVGSTIGTHGGPGVLLIAFWGPDRRTLK